MATIQAPAPVTTRARRRTPRSVVTGRVLTGFVSAFLAFDAISHITQPQVVKDAVAANVQIQAGFFDGIMLPVYTAVLVWGGLWLRDAEVRAVVPFRR